MGSSTFNVGRQMKDEDEGAKRGADGAQKWNARGTEGNQRGGGKRVPGLLAGMTEATGYPAWPRVWRLIALSYSLFIG